MRRHRAPAAPRRPARRRCTAHRTARRRECWACRAAVRRAGTGNSPWRRIPARGSPVRRIRRRGDIGDGEAGHREPLGEVQWPNIAYAPAWCAAGPSTVEIVIRHRSLGGVRPVRRCRPGATAMMADIVVSGAVDHKQCRQANVPASRPQGFAVGNWRQRVLRAGDEQYRTPDGADLTASDPPRVFDQEFRRIPEYRRDGVPGGPHVGVQLRLVLDGAGALAVASSEIQRASARWHGQAPPAR